MERIFFDHEADVALIREGDSCYLSHLITLSGYDEPETFSN